MKIGLVGYKGSGKSTLFEWLTGAAADPALGHTTQAAMAPVPDDRVEAVSEIFHPKKTTLAALEIVDTPGLSRTHEGSAAKLVMIREAGCLVLVVGAYDADPEAMRSFLARVRQAHGSMEKWAREAGIDESAQGRLRSRLLR